MPPPGVNFTGQDAAFRPEEAARALRSRSGLVVLESRAVGAEPLTLLACEPDLLLEGGPADWPILERELEARKRPGTASPLPDGAAVGWVDFDGRFRFGFYDALHLYLHGPAQWRNPPQGEFFQPEPRFPSIPFAPRMDRDHFVSLVQRAQEYIAAGDIYQVCLSHQFTAPFAGDAWPFFEALRRHSPAPHAAFLDLGGTQVVSSSPECFLNLSGRTITTRPIKGTRPRRADARLDQCHASDLITSPKEIAELVMITDLERNDLGRICAYGSVHVPELAKIESFEHVHHLVSTVTGTLRAEVSHPAALLSCFPGGSISGAPKKRALEIIAELEPVPRGLYTGAIGYLGYNGESRFNIAIRTAVFENGLASFHVGAGIVADSIPDNEWQETLDKAAGLLEAGCPDSKRFRSCRRG